MLYLLNIAMGEEMRRCLAVVSTLLKMERRMELTIRSVCPLEANKYDCTRGMYTWKMLHTTTHVECRPKESELS